MRKRKIKTFKAPRIWYDLVIAGTPCNMSMTTTIFALVAMRGFFCYVATAIYHHVKRSSVYLRVRRNTRERKWMKRRRVRNLAHLCESACKRYACIKLVYYLCYLYTFSFWRCWLKSCVISWKAARELGNSRVRDPEVPFGPTIFVTGALNFSSSFSHSLLLSFPVLSRFLASHTPIRKIQEIIVRGRSSYL